MYIRTEIFSLDWLCGMYIRTETYYLDWLCLIYIPTDFFSRIHRVGYTYLRKCFLGFTVWDVHTYGNDWVSMPRPIAHGPGLCPRRAYPRRFLGRVGRTPLSHTLTWRRFQMPSWKGVKNRLYSTLLYHEYLTGKSSATVYVVPYIFLCFNFVVLLQHSMTSY